jgi:hypothetical protein
LIADDSIHADSSILLRLPCLRSDNPIYRQTCALLEIFDGLFGRRVEAAGNIAGRKCLGHYKYALKSSHVVASRTDAECWTAIHKLYASLAIS